VDNLLLVHYKAAVAGNYPVVGVDNPRKVVEVDNPLVGHYKVAGLDNLLLVHRKVAVAGNYLAVEVDNPLLVHRKVAVVD
jgi:hypothetical protein